jgi:DNA-binding beta-propeller fold protein YncE
MHHFRSHGLVVAVLLGVAGCSGVGAPQSTPLAAVPAHQSLGAAYPTRTSLVFESDETQDTVNVYQTNKLPNNPYPIATIAMQKGCPYGLAMSNGGTLYVANYCNGGDVELYPRGSTEMSSAITQGISNPRGLAMSHKDVLFVSNYPASITEYERGKISPSKTLTGGGLADPFGLALDSHENLYIADYGADKIFEVKAGTSTIVNSNLQNVGEPVGLAIDVKNDVLWETDYSSNSINVYHLRGMNKAPFEVIEGQGRPYAIALQNFGNPLGEVVESDDATSSIYAYKPNTYKPYATLNRSVGSPLGLLIAKP